MNINYGISSMFLWQNDIKKLVTYLNDKNIDYLEIKPKKNHFQCQDLNSIKKIKKILEKNQINVTAIHMPVKDIDISSYDEYDRVKSVREIEKTIMTAFWLNAETVIVHPGGNYENKNDLLKKIETSIKSLQEIVEFSKKWGIKIALENRLPGILGDNITDLKTILEKIPSNQLGICLDTGHYHINKCLNEQSGVDFGEEFHVLGKDVIHIHIHDNDGVRDQHLLPGDGKIDWNSFFKFIKKINYNGKLIIETKKQKLDIFSSRLEKSLQILDNSK